MTSLPITNHLTYLISFISQGAMRSSRKSSENEQYGAFRIPNKIPAEEDWEPDYKHSVCMICKEVVFNMVCIVFHICCFVVYTSFVLFNAILMRSIDAQYDRGYLYEYVLGLAFYWLGIIPLFDWV